MESERQFWSTGIKKGLNLLLSLSFLQIINGHSSSNYHRPSRYRLHTRITDVTVLRTAFHGHTKITCNFCFWFCLLRSYQSKIVLPFSSHNKHKYQWYNSRTRSWSSVFVIVCIQSLVLSVNMQQCNARMPHHWASHSEAFASL